VIVSRRLRSACLPLLLSLAGSALAQRVDVYSEFQRIGLSGEILEVDRAAEPREILSPAIARNGYASFRVKVTMPPGQYYHLYVEQNPKDTVRVQVYREVLQKFDSGWIPDILQPVKIPYSGKVADNSPVGLTAAADTFWLDIYVPPKAPSRRFRVEVQVNTGDRWDIYPMEVRILSTRIPDHKETGGTLPAPEEPADAAVLAVLQTQFCEEPATPEELTSLTIRRMIRRNALQDSALARSLEPMHGKGFWIDQIASITGAANRQAWCASPPRPKNLGAEWHLRARDFIYRTAQDPIAPAP
jgi:hypothetical protein